MVGKETRPWNGTAYLENRHEIVGSEEVAHLPDRILLSSADRVVRRVARVGHGGRGSQSCSRRCLGFSTSSKVQVVHAAGQGCLPEFLPQTDNVAQAEILVGGRPNLSARVVSVWVWGGGGWGGVGWGRGGRVW